MRLAFTVPLASLVLSSTLVTTGCVLPAGPEGPDVDEPTQPVTPLAAQGTFQTRTQLDITIEALLPEPAANFVGTLREFSINPAHTLISLAEDAGVPAVGTLRSLLPDALESRLEGWINDELAKVQLDGVPVAQVAGALAGLAATSLTEVAVDSELTIADGLSTHRLVTLDFGPAGIAAALALGGLPGDATTATATATTTATTTTTTLSIGDHGFALAYGEYAWQALDASFVDAHGADIRTTIGTAVNCPLIAARVASKCVFSLCVGHATEITELCERGLDEVVERAHAKFASYRFDAMHLAAGTATLVDTTSDGFADRLEGGVWTAEINAGMGLRPAPATFTASR